MVDATTWSLAVYLAGGDGLNAGMIRTLQELRDETLVNHRTRVLAQYEPNARAPRRFEFPARKRESGTQGLHALANYEYRVDRPQGGHVSAQELLHQFVRTSRDLDNAENSMLVLSGHGNGAVGELFGFRGAGRAIDVKDLGNVLSDALGDKKIDIIGMDCCNMSMVEVGFELAPNARFLVASESEVPSYGWPYRQVLSRTRQSSPEEAAPEIARAYAEFYADYNLTGVSTHCAACELDGIETLVPPIRTLAEALHAGVHDPNVWRPIVLAHWEAQSYKNEEYVDLADFCLRLYKHIADDAIAAMCIDVMRAVGRVVMESRYTGGGFQYSTGLSIYFPWSHDLAKGTGEVGADSALDAYKKLVFSQKTSWGDFLDAYLVSTRRNDRACQPATTAQSFSPALELVARCSVPSR